MNLTTKFTKLANRVVCDLFRSKGLETKKDLSADSHVSLIGRGRRHKVGTDGSVKSGPNIIAQYTLKDLIDATKDVALPKLQMMMRMVQSQLTPAPQQELQAVRVRTNEKPRRTGL